MMASSYKKIAFLGEGGVGKSTILRLLTDKRLNKTYRPTIGVNFGSLKVNEFDVALWDIAGQDRFHFMWPGFIRGSNILFLVTDSSPRNVLKTRQLLQNIVEKADQIKKKQKDPVKTLGKGYGFGEDVKIIAIANKQDLPGSMNPRQVADLLGVPCYGMVAIDPQQRLEMHNILKDEMDRNLTV
ncbi:MAG: ADP-ribosylation factor-like protein [Candidatus Ranarchaeia archaeon]|jgi:small GTP-binding protein